MIKNREQAEAVQKRRKDAGLHGLAGAVRRFLRRSKTKASEVGLPKNVRPGRPKKTQEAEAESTVRVIEATA